MARKYDIIYEEQPGFNKDNSVFDIILLLKETLQIYKNKKKALFVCFFDLSKAFDSIPIHELKYKLMKILPKSKMLSTIIKCLDWKTYKVLYEGEETSPYNLKNGTPQRDSMPSTLFSLYLNDLIDIFRQNENRTDPVIIHDMKITSAVYADDILLMSESKGLIKQIKIVQTYCKENGLQINYYKTKIMVKNIPQKYSSLESAFEGTRNKIEIVMEYLERIRKNLPL